MPKFFHNGKIGDIIFSLPTVEQLGGGVYYIQNGLLLGTKEIESLKPLLKNQPYIEDVLEYNGEKIDYNLSSFRYEKWRIEAGKSPKPTMNIVDYTLFTFGLPPADPVKRWLVKVEPIYIPGKRFGVSLTPRYFNADVDWSKLIQDIKDQCIFVGTRYEWIDFCRYSNTIIDFFETKDLLELQALLEGLSHIYCGVGGVNAVAEAIKMPMTVAIASGSDVVFARPDLEIIKSYR